MSYGRWVMRFSLGVAVIAAAGFALYGCSGRTASLSVAQGTGPAPILPAPAPTLFPTVKVAPVIGWRNGATPIAAPGLQVANFARNLQHPRWLYALPNGDVLVAESESPRFGGDSKGIRGMVAGLIMSKAGAGGESANKIILLRPTPTGVEQHDFITGLFSPFGMVLVGHDFYVADTDAVLRFPYTDGATRIATPGVKLLDLPGGPIDHHWTKNIVASKDGTKLYVSVGSNSNVGENGMAAEQGRAAIWEIDRATGAHRIFASGLRNPVGMAWEPVTGALWVAVNERDELGSDLVPDYMTHVEDGAFYGWPYSYFGQHVDNRVHPQRPDLVAKAIVPDYALGPHTASLGLTFSHPGALPDAFSQGAFIGQHGSWNRNPPSGYKVVFVPFKDGKPAGMPVDVLTGFLTTKGEAQGRPVGVTLDKEGALLVADDVGNAVWRVVGAGKPSEP
ncbi:MAG TPA: sorbosone dehydrogenase family protein [Acetobacteraceae bacterium]|nr:sorbosone dehydrogenase family protein [Acetobacteraceae bacterium]